MPPGPEGVNFPHMGSVGSLKGGTFMALTGGSWGATLALLPLSVHCNFVLMWRDVICVRRPQKLKTDCLYALCDLQH